MHSPLVSIIIPTYNRAHLIGETLDSVLAQTYRNWECIVVDDGSTDYTDELLEFYIEKDSRIQYCHRPKDRRKGANACRNYGFELSKGEYVNWFDSDDLMTGNHIFELLKFLVKNKEIDMAIGNSLNFKDGKMIGRPYNFDIKLPVTAEYFIQEKIGWITNDVLLRKTAVVLGYNEKLAFGQEFNFFARLLLKNIKAAFVSKDISIRRIHNFSIQGKLNKKGDKNHFGYFKNEFYLLEDIKEDASLKIINRSLRRLVRYSYFLTPAFSKRKIQKLTLKSLFKENRTICVFYYFAWIQINNYFGKGYYVINLTMKRLN